MVQVYFFEIDVDKCDEWFNRLKGFVSAEKVERAEKMKHSIDRALTICAEAVVRYLAGTNLGMKNSDIFFEKNEFGKPHLKGCPTFCFNAAHTRDAMTVAVSDSEIGVDIEQLKKADLKIAERFFSDSEQKFILHSADRNRAFYEIWTRKEAYIKFIGKGLSIDLNSFDTLDAEIYDCTRVYEQNGYFISVCGKNLQCVSFNTMDFGEFLQNHIAP